VPQRHEQVQTWIKNWAVYGKTNSQTSLFKKRAKVRTIAAEREIILQNTISKENPQATATQ